MMSHYPTKDQILDAPPLASLASLRAFQDWRAHNGKIYRQGDAAVRVEALARLVSRIAKAEDIEITLKPSTFYAYPPTERVLLFDAAKPSIISTLHELGHALFGVSELAACSYSVQLFRAVYPRGYDRLTWQGHLLVKAS